MFCKTSFPHLNHDAFITDADAVVLKWLAGQSHGRGMYILLGSMAALSAEQVLEFAIVILLLDQSFICSLKEKGYKICWGDSFKINKQFEPGDQFFGASLCCAKSDIGSSLYRSHNQPLLVERNARE